MSTRFVPEKKTGVHDYKLTTLGKLRPGAIFMIRNGTMAVKTAYRDLATEQCECILLISGEYANFEQGDSMLVDEVEIVY
jgi:hypothetical protein